jgi:hypothetical protein
MTTGRGRSTGQENRRPTKAERREQARLEREAIKRQMARRRRNRSIGLGVVAVAAVVAVVAVVLARPESTALASPTDLLAQASTAAQTAGCDRVQTTDNYRDAPGGDPEIDHVHIGSGLVTSAPKLSTYPTIPPVSGPHDPTPLPAGVYDSPPDVYRIIHSMEHAAVIIWYRPGSGGSELSDLKRFYRESDASITQKVIVAPYDYPEQGAAGELPSGVDMALGAWHRLRTCGSVNLAVAFDFSSRFTSPPYDGRTYQGVAREPQNTI